MPGTILVIGADGFVGRRLVRFLLKKGHHVLPW
jgi:nucleoside-diphosphate-sugar epimerase